jgi:predicted nucleic acid-binding protein
LLSDYLPLRPLVLDASAIINLLGCGDMPGVLKALGVVCLVEEKTLGEVERHPVPGHDHRPVIRALLQTGALKVERMSGPEYEIYISLVQGNLAGRLDDGESAAIALASRGFPVVIDENKARRVLAQRFPGTPFCSTFRLLLTAGQRASWPLEAVQHLVLSARRHARMGVPREERAQLQNLMEGYEGWADV